MKFNTGIGNGKFHTAACELCNTFNAVWHPQKELAIKQKYSFVAKLHWKLTLNLVIPKWSALLIKKDLATAAFSSLSDAQTYLNSPTLSLHISDNLPLF